MHLDTLVDRCYRLVRLMRTALPGFANAFPRGGRLALSLRLQAAALRAQFPMSAAPFTRPNALAGTLT